MPPRIDPYSNKTHKRIDALLVVITLVLMIFVFQSLPRRSGTKAGGPEATHAAQAQTSVHK
jgi:hypothetical protein